MQPECEFPRPVAIADLGDEDVVMEISATPGERAALSRRFDLLALDSLTATVRVGRAGGGSVRVHARFAADVVQACVVTLDPVAGRIEDSVEVVFAPPDGSEQAVVVVAPEGDDDPEPLTGDAIDIGEVVAEQLGLALDPYPRRPDAVFAGIGEAADDDPAGKSPFAVLQDLKPGS